MGKKNKYWFGLTFLYERVTIWLVNWSDWFEEPITNPFRWTGQHSMWISHYSRGVDAAQRLTCDTLRPPHVPFAGAITWRNSSAIKFFFFKLSWYICCYKESISLWGLCISIFFFLTCLCKGKCQVRSTQPSVIFLHLQSIYLSI